MHLLALLDTVFTRNNLEMCHLAHPSQSSPLSVPLSSAEGPHRELREATSLRTTVARSGAVVRVADTQSQHPAGYRVSGCGCPVPAL